MHYGNEKLVSDLKALIEVTESMDNHDKAYWNALIPDMDEEQMKRLFLILKTEKDKLNELDREHDQLIISINQEHLIEMKEIEETRKNNLNPDFIHYGAI